MVPLEFRIHKTLFCAVPKVGLSGHNNIEILPFSVRV
jgi:hypothetical protein